MKKLLFVSMLFAGVMHINGMNINNKNTQNSDVSSEMTNNEMHEATQKSMHSDVPNQDQETELNNDVTKMLFIIDQYKKFPPLLINGVDESNDRASLEERINEQQKTITQLRNEIESLRNAGISLYKGIQSIWTYLNKSTNDFYNNFQNPNMGQNDSDNNFSNPNMDQNGSDNNFSNPNMGQNGFHSTKREILARELIYQIKNSVSLLISLYIISAIHQRFSPDIQNFITTSHILLPIFKPIIDTIIDTIIDNYFNHR